MFDALFLGVEIRKLGKGIRYRARDLWQLRRTTPNIWGAHLSRLILSDIKCIRQSYSVVLATAITESLKPGTIPTPNQAIKMFVGIQVQQKYLR